ncbi:MAG: DUF5652 family protein [Candidatus Moranbacteria bacterium]|jgi:hypothetical protein|nr:DUF5652 family protein [Candidatus Moranbacteria bacterium]
MQNIETLMLIWLIPLLIWELVWKGIALWKAAKNNQLNWFTALLILNTVGILPIIYIQFFQKNKE